MSSIPRVRRIAFPFRCHPFLGDNIVLSHVVAALSGLFPGGEDYFVRSVHRYADRLDPRLKERVRGFCGQEVTHALQHRRLNGLLAEDGYLIQWLDEHAGRHPTVFPASAEKWLPGRVHLAATAALEHFTAILAYRMLSSDEMQAMPMDPEVRGLLNWHSVEEIEHKSVAFDVYRAVGGSEALRIGVMAVVATGAAAVVTALVAVSLLCDRNATRHPWRVLRETRQQLRGPLFGHLLRDVLPYLRPGFHPDDIDTDDVLEQWRQKLFGSDGALVGYLK